MVKFYCSILGVNTLVYIGFSSVIQVVLISSWSVEQNLEYQSRLPCQLTLVIGWSSALFGHTK